MVSVVFVGCGIMRVSSDWVSMFCNREKSERYIILNSDKNILYQVMFISIVFLG